MKKEMDKDQNTFLNEGIIFVQLNKKDGCICPCCGRVCKVYKRSITGTMLKSFSNLNDITYGDFIFSGDKKTYFHVSEFAYKHKIAEIAKLALWDFIEPLRNEDTAKRCSGKWRITEKGKQFLKGSLSVPKYMHVYNDQVVGQSDKTVRAEDVANKKFNYQEIK